MKAPREGCGHLYFALCVHVHVYVCVKYFLHLGNYLQFAEKANLSLSAVLKLHYTAGAAYREARSTSFFVLVSKHCELVDQLLKHVFQNNFNK